MKTVLLSFPDDKTRDRYLQLVKAASDMMLRPDTIARDGTAKRDGEILQAALGTVKLDPPVKADHERNAAVFVSGQKMVEGTLTDMRKRFMQEVDSHSATVEIRELRDGEWHSIASRRLQQPQRV